MSGPAGYFALGSRSAGGLYAGSFIGTLAWHIDHLAFL
jgi:hypothetical protein